MRNILLQLGELGLDIAYKRRAAGTGQESLLRQLRGLIVRDHVRTQRRLDNAVDTQLLDSGNDLA